MPEFKLAYESQLDAFHPSYRWETQEPQDDWKTAALRGPALPVLGNAAAGAVGSAISSVIVYPLSVIVARLQTQQKKDKSKEGSSSSDDEEEYKDIVDAAYKIYQEEGIAGFYPGLAQDTFKTRIIARVGAAKAAKSKNIVLPILDELAVGVVAGSFAKLFTTPLSNIVTRKQLAARKAGKGKGKGKGKDDGEELSTSDIAAQIRAEKGIRGFWSGYSATLILTLNPSITFFLNEVLKYALLSRAKRERPSAAVTFLLAALSKSAASSITYPFSLAKTRAQALSSSRSAAGVKSSSSILSTVTPKIVSTVGTIARTEGISALYAGLPGEVLKGFFSHGFTMLAKDAVYASIVKCYYFLLMVFRRYPSPDELIQRAREQAEEFSEVAREGARDLVERTKEGAEEALTIHSGNVNVDVSSNAAAAAAASAAKDASAGHGVDASSGLKVPPLHDEINETAELVGDYVEDEAAEWKSFYHWFWDKERGYNPGKE
ncbi:Mitochondrial substrate/solute carrier [Penicillium waksmanii]|uniref:Mitochondrial substrate/solute carrier n=1 Tax=Penicillium waksmanii TaxID=69791 RepID=UPI002549964C|nr:Mitochondrial substrate/solute carrier [Penicillium waksmanii]KAJ5983722.1 Mitochondrial substrate/solute carrier [Penicillium waksmanii]